MADVLIGLILMLDCWIQGKLNLFKCQGGGFIYTFLQPVSDKDMQYSLLKDIDHAPDVFLAYQQGYGESMP